MSKEIIVVVDFGHGLPDPGAVRFGQEYLYTAMIGREVAKRLPDSVKVVFTRTTDNALNPDKEQDLASRCAIANKAEAVLFVSIHLNAGGGTGYETFVYSSSDEDKAIHAEIVKVLKKYGLQDRGIKIRTELDVLEYTKMKAVILKCLFIDNKSDMDKMNNQTFFNEFCQAADGIAKTVGVTPKSTGTLPKKEETIAEQEPSPFAAKSWKHMTEMGITDRNRPQNPITRQEVVVMLDRLYDELKK
ncbi:hypothetical protein BTO30_15775 [Domibacillus antri]|uniref:MurNAc-LAA domain-containing protein n=1 Tax=Domibacillus antri TaxID=1714264 RepID=A0A1Q8Q1R3_9BACI|nr:N-acetylmuramoyl-L-alanine amidase [Domibacillus antri]OLN21283.1 hypothetical protein BTO30_15775 [Domibacillus antri]